jgi:hypothetical protein
MPPTPEDVAAAFSRDAARLLNCSYFTVPPAAVSDAALPGWFADRAAERDRLVDAIDAAPTIGSPDVLPADAKAVWDRARLALEDDMNLDADAARMSDDFTGGD